METPKKTGVWMDHSNAFIIKLTDSGHLPKIIISGYNIHDKKMAMEQRKKGKTAVMLKKQRAYHNDIVAAIEESDEVFLFGPTDAKKELFVTLRRNRNFDTIPIAFDSSFKIKNLQQSNFFSGQGMRE